MIRTLLLPAAAIPLAAQAQQKAPNIIVYIADDAGIDFGCYGNPYVKTPNIDRLASNGVRFQNAFVTASQSSPSRIAMMTGLWAHTLGVEDLNDVLDDKTRMLPSYLKEAGYYTGAMLKTHWGDNGTKQFDFYFNGRQPAYSEEYMTEQNPFFKQYQKFLNSCNGKPFFMWVGFIDPHRPYKEPHTKAVHSPKNVIIPPALVDTPETRQDIADYYDEIHRLDQHVGFMTAELERRGELENTVILFLSDNGMPFHRAKAFVYDAGLQVPLIVSWPGRTQPGSVHRNGLVSAIDLAPTILEMAGMKTPEEMYGTSILPLILDPSLRGREEIFGARNWHCTEDYMRCIRTERYKLIYNAYPNKLAPVIADVTQAPSWWDLMDAKLKGNLNAKQMNVFVFPRPQIELYDVQADPGEFVNLAFRAESQPIVNDLLKRMRDWQKQTGDRDWWERERDDDNDRVTGQLTMPLKSR